MSNFVLRDTYRRSRNGLWVRGRVDGGEGVVESQVRHRVEGGVVQQLGADGEVIGQMSPFDVQYGAEWKEHGRVDLDALAVSRVARRGKVGALQRGVLAHAVALVAHGWGKSPEEVVGWFTPESIDARKCVVEGFYFVAESGGMFAGLERTPIEVVSVERLAAEFVLGGDRVEFSLDDDEALGDFLSYTLPDA